MQVIIDSKERRSFAANLVANITADPLMEVIIQPYVEDKSGEQRAWWHKMIAIFAKEAGYTPGNLKEALKQEILGTDQVEVLGKIREVTPSSEELKKDQYSDLIENTYRIAAEAGIVLPNPRYRDG